MPDVKQSSGQQAAHELARMLSRLLRSPTACFATGVATAVAFALLRRRIKALADADDDADPDDERQVLLPKPPALDVASGRASAADTADGTFSPLSPCSPARQASLGRPAPSLRRGMSIADVAEMAISKLAKGVSGTLQERMTFVERRYFTPPRFTVEMCEASDADLRPWQEMRQRWLLAVADGSVPAPKVHNRLWVTYRMWVDANVAGREGRPDMFHNFCIARALGVPTPSVGGGPRWWTGAEAGDLIACLAAEGVLVRGCETGKAAMEDFLQASLEAYNGRFLLAQNRTVSGFTRADEGTWTGGYFFVQLADPQLGAFRNDADWAEEVTMLRLAVQHVNRLKPKFLLVSGDLTNVWPSAKTRDILAAQVGDAPCSPLSVSSLSLSLSLHLSINPSLAPSLPPD